MKTTASSASSTSSREGARRSLHFTETQQTHDGNAEGDGQVLMRIQESSSFVQPDPALRPVYRGISRTTIALLGEIDHLNQEKHRHWQRQHEHQRQRKRRRNDSSPDLNPGDDDQDESSEEVVHDQELRSSLDAIESRISSLENLVLAALEQRRETTTVSSDKSSRAAADSHRQQQNDYVGQRNWSRTGNPGPSPRELFLEEYVDELRNTIKNISIVNEQLRPYMEHSEKLEQENGELRSAVNELYLIYRCVAYEPPSR